MSTLPSSIGLAKFKEAIEKKPWNDAKTTIWPSTPLDTSLATRLFGAVLGYEGEHVFPTVLSDQSQWTPPPQLIEDIQRTIEQERSRGEGQLPFPSSC
jgi:hypothetical protein